MGIFHVFQIVQMVPNHAKHYIYDLRASFSTTDFMAVVADGISRALNMSIPTRAKALDITKSLGRI